LCRSRTLDHLCWTLCMFVRLTIQDYFMVKLYI
jgi:hypothetical protein